MYHFLFHLLKKCDPNSKFSHCLQKKPLRHPLNSNSGQEILPNEIFALCSNDAKSQGHAWWIF